MPSFLAASGAVRLRKYRHLPQWRADHDGTEHGYLYR